MYGLPENFSPDVFVGERLLQVCIGESDVILKFDPPMTVTVTSSIARAVDGQPRQVFEHLQEAGRWIVGLLGKTVVSASADDRRALRLRFQGGAEIEVLDDSDQFESFLIQRGENLIVV